MIRDASIPARWVQNGLSLRPVFYSTRGSLSFMITIGGNSQTGNYTRFTDPNLAVAPGFTSTASGVSDVGGANSLINSGSVGRPEITHVRRTQEAGVGRYVHA